MCFFSFKISTKFCYQDIDSKPAGLLIGAEEYSNHFLKTLLNLASLCQFWPNCFFSISSDVFHVNSLKTLYFISMNLTHPQEATFQCTGKSLMPAVNTVDQNYQEG